MDILNFKKKINKISILTDSIENGSFSALERDLLLTYVRDLYDIAMGDEPIVIKRTEIQAATSVEMSTPVFIEKPVTINNEIQETVKVAVETHIPEVPVKSTPVVTMTEPEIQVKSAPIAIEVPAVAVAEVPVKAVPLVEKIKVAVPAQHLNENEVMEALFSEGIVNDLSDKLGLTPVQDLTKSMGINERIFTQQELFANNPAKFTEVLTVLNGFQSFDEAKQYLINTVIPEHGWTDESKIKKASTFIKLVKRKYL